MKPDKTMKPDETIAQYNWVVIDKMIIGQHSSKTGAMSQAKEHVRRNGHPLKIAKIKYHLKAHYKATVEKVKP